MQMEPENTFFICSTVAFVALVLGVTFYQVNRNYAEVEIARAHAATQPARVER